jgi:hypothetical protein
MILLTGRMTGGTAERRSSWSMTFQAAFSRCRRPKQPRKRHINNVLFIRRSTFQNSRDTLELFKRQFAKKRVEPTDQQFSCIDGGEQEEFEALLRQDLRHNLYEILGAKELWLSRPQYQSRCGTLRAFRDLIYAEERRQKRVAKYRREREE